MANFFPNKGSNSFSRAVLVEDALVKNSDTDFTIQQPAGSVLSKVYVRFASAPSVGSSGKIGLTIGTDEGGTQVLADASANNIKAANASQAEANAIVQATLANTAVGQNAPAANAGYTDAARDLHVRIKMSNHNVTTNCDLELSFFFDKLK